MRVIAEGLAEWGVLKVPAEQALREDSGLYRRYTLCSSGHMLGQEAPESIHGLAVAVKCGAGNPSFVKRPTP